MTALYYSLYYRLLYMYNSLSTSSLQHAVTIERLANSLANSAPLDSQMQRARRLHGCTTAIAAQTSQMKQKQLYQLLRSDLVLKSLNIKVKGTIFLKTYIAALVISLFKKRDEIVKEKKRVLQLLKQKRGRSWPTIPNM